jgi:hypothetical protein
MAMAAKRSASDTTMMPRSATGLLRADHKRVKEIFDKWEAGRGGTKSADLMRMAILELKVHAQIEEEIFYPAAREAMGEEDLLNEAEEEHHVAKFLIDELEEMDFEDPVAEAKFKVLAENVKHHIREEEGELFPQIADEDFNRSIAEELFQRKQQLMAEDGDAPPRRDGGRPRTARRAVVVKDQPRAVRAPAAGRRSRAAVPTSVPVGRSRAAATAEFGRVQGKNVWMAGVNPGHLRFGGASSRRRRRAPSARC